MKKANPEKKVFTKKKEKMKKKKTIKNMQINRKFTSI